MSIKKSRSIVYVAMSGGVDSSVAAALLKQQGFNVVGVYFKPWSPSQKLFAQKSVVETNYYCDWESERRDAMQAAAVIGIPFKTWDFSRRYGTKVARYMIDSYRHGLTPNPDVMCNKEIKFGLFLKKALAEGADFIATGHYARRQGQKLLKAKDGNKDQTYFLWTLTPLQLKRCLFPIGDFAKPTVRQLAKKFGLPNYAKKDSQGVCFVGQMDVKDFLQTQIKPRRGNIHLIDSNELIGQHDGIYYYTIGQRHGLNIKRGDGPYYVYAKAIRKNIIYVTKNQASLNAKRANVMAINWLKRAGLPVNAAVSIRYGAKALPARIEAGDQPDTAVIKFKKFAHAIASGQSAVFYSGRQLLGGGIIR